MSVLIIFIQKAIVQGICILYGALGEIITENHKTIKMTDQVLNKRKFLFRFRLKNQEDIIYITSFDLILIFQWDLLKETKFGNQVR